jgi:D-3-phosphoglycerate dehydrogenase
MFTIGLLNQIAPEAVRLLPPDKYKVVEGLPDDADAVIVRSADMHALALPKTLKAIARAGIGVNNIPVETCTEKNIAVFYTPGANANAVKELALAALLLSSRRLYQGMNWAQSLTGQGNAVEEAIEKGKSQFVGPEIKGKCLGVIGLGAIGVMLAHDALALGMEVIGYDPYMPAAIAKQLSPKVSRTDDLKQLMRSADYITIHVPLLDSTRGMLGAEAFKLMKPGVRIINLARGELVDNEAMLQAVKLEKVACYVTDFPTAAMLGSDRILTFPHLGASTPEAETNCAAMAVRQLRDFLERDVVANSVNFSVRG